MDKINELLENKHGNSTRFDKLEKSITKLITTTTLHNERLNEHEDRITQVDTDLKNLIKHPVSQDPCHMARWPSR